MGNGVFSIAAIVANPVLKLRRGGAGEHVPPQVTATKLSNPSVTYAKCQRPLLLTAIFTGLRAPELRRLRRQDLDLKKGELHIGQRADWYRAIGAPKTEAGERTVPLPPILISCPEGGASSPQARRERQAGPRAKI